MAAPSNSGPGDARGPKNPADSTAPKSGTTRKTASADVRSLKIIDDRHDVLQSLPAGALGAVAAREAATSDVEVLKRFTDKTLQDRAAAVIGETADLQPAYRTALRDASPQLAGLAEQAFAGDQQRSAVKQDRKSFEFASRRDDAANSIAERYATMTRAGLTAKDLQGPALERLANRDSHDLLLIDGFPPHPRASEAKALIADSLKSDTYRVGFERETAGWAAARADIAPRQETKPAAERAESPTNSMRAEGAATEKRRAIPPLEDRFNVQGVGLLEKTYRFRDQAGKVAFTDKLLSISTETESPAAIQAMVDRAAERGWQTVRLSGSPEFVRQGWVAATAQGLTAAGHAPTLGDKDAAAQERTRFIAIQGRASEQRPGEPLQRVQSVQPQRKNGDRGHTELADQRQLAKAIEKALAEGQVSPELRGQVRAMMVAEGANRAASGDRLKVPLYDVLTPRATTRGVQAGLQRQGNRERSR